MFREKGREEWPKNEWRFRGYNSKHSSDAITDLSLAWLKRRDKSKPFFLMHHCKAPHDNFENAKRYDWLYADIDIPEPARLDLVAETVKDAGESSSYEYSSENPILAVA